MELQVPTGMRRYQIANRREESLKAQRPMGRFWEGRLAEVVTDVWGMIGSYSYLHTQCWL